jgi:hypothetical protein
MASVAWMQAEAAQQLAGVARGVIGHKQHPVVQVEKELASRMKGDAGELFNGFPAQQQVQHVEPPFAIRRVEEVWQAIEPRLPPISQQRFETEDETRIDVDHRLERVIQRGNDPPPAQVDRGLQVGRHAGYFGCDLVCLADVHHRQCRRPL